MNGLKGPLEDEWEEKVGAFASRIALGVAEGPREAATGVCHAQPARIY